MVFLPHWPPINEKRSMKYDLSRMEYFLDSINNPHTKMPPSIHVAGTNGKGSTIAFIRAILEEAGFKVNVFTSPHIISFNERIVIAGSNITDCYLHSLIEECRIACEKRNLSPSFFEVATAAAFIAFARSNSDICIIETGIGGRLDATNVIQNPILTVITPISYDHMNVLGNSIKQIASEKAGIIKQNSPCIVSMQTQKALDVIEHYSELKDAPLFRYEYEFGITKHNGLFYYNSNITSTNNIQLQPSLQGYHQYVNATTAVAAVTNLKQLNISIKHIVDGVMKAQWPHRLEHIKHGKITKLIPSDWQIILDAAHNESGAQALSQWLKSEDKKKNILIIGMTKNRDIYKFISHFKGLLDKIICVSIESEPFSYKASDMLEQLKKYKLNTVVNKKENIEDALLHTIEEEKNTQSSIRILITGSIFLTSDFSKYNSNL